MAAAAAAAEAAAAVATFPDVAAALTVCQTSENEQAALIGRERLTDIGDFAELTPKDITDLASKLERRTVADGRTLLPAKVVKNLQALCFWARERSRRGEQLSGRLFTAAELALTKEIMRIREEGQKEAPSIKPEKFDPEKWTTWSKQFVTYLSHINGQHYAPLDYVIREEPPPQPIQEMTERDRAIYAIPLHGKSYALDNTMVFRLLSDLVSGTPGHTWINGDNRERSQDGRGAWKALVEHYEGGGQREKRITAALATIRQLHYKNESVYSFEEFSRRLIQAYRDLDGTEEKVEEVNKVKTLLEKIEISLPRAEVAKAHVRQNFKHSLIGAIEYLGTEFADMFADAIATKRARARGISAIERPAQRLKGSEDEQPRRTPEGVMVFFGVDVTDVTRTFTPQEMSDLGARGQAYVFQERDRINGWKAGAGRGGGRGNNTRGRSGGRGGGSRRQVGAVETQQQALTWGTPPEEFSAVTESTRLPPAPPAETQPPTAARPPGLFQNVSISRGSKNGSNFGGGAYQA